MTPSPTEASLSASRRGRRPTLSVEVEPVPAGELVPPAADAAALLETDAGAVAAFAIDATGEAATMALVDRAVLPICVALTAVNYLDR